MDEVRINGGDDELSPLHIGASSFRTKKIIIGAVLVFFGIVIGAYLFSDTHPRMFISPASCHTHCLKKNELLGLLVSIGVQRFPDLFPMVIKETDKTIAIVHPYPATAIHYLIIPKKDIPDPANISRDDEPYLADAFALIRAIVEEQHLKKYRIIVNGPGYQEATYLHFHLMSNETPAR